MTTIARECPVVFAGGEPAPRVIGVTAGAWLEPLAGASPTSLRRVAGKGDLYGYYLLPTGRRIVAIESPGGYALPNAVTAPSSVVACLNRASRVTFGAGCVVFDGGVLRLRQFTRHRPVLDVMPEAAVSAGQALTDALASRGASPAAAIVERAVHEFAQVLRRWPGDDLAPFVDRLVGLGPGSTPAGDDVVAGAISTLKALARGRGAVAGRCARLADTLCRSLRERLDRTTPLSATLLECAAQGDMLPRLSRCLDHAVAGHRPARAFDELRRVGHDSGHFLATGAAAALCAVMPICLES